MITQREISQPSNVSCEELNKARKIKELKRLKRAYNAVRKVWESAELFDVDNREDDIDLTTSLNCLYRILVRNKEL